MDLKMLKFFFRLGLVLLALNVFVTSCEALSGGYDTKYESNLYEEILRQKSASLAASAFESLSTERGLGLSAWGIITVVVSIILAIVGMYYISICYPVLCKKSRKYDTMELPPPV